MSRYRSLVEFKKLEKRVRTAKHLRHARGMSFPDISNVMGISLSTAHEYVVKGDALLRRNKPKDLELEHWQEIGQQLLALYETGIREDKFSMVVDMWKREIRDPAFGELLDQLFERESIEVNNDACGDEDTHN